LATRTEKLTTLPDAVRMIPEGARVAFGGFPMIGKPMALVREVIRQGRSITVVGTSNGPDADLLAAARLLDRIETAYVGLEEFGLAPSFRRAADAGEFDVVDYSEAVAFDRFRASQDNLPFVACPQIAGTDLAAKNPEIREFPCPITGRPMLAAPSANIGVAVVHAPAADVFGNVLYPATRVMIQGLDHTLVNAADVVIVSVERIVDELYVRKHAELTRIPAFRTSAVVHAPFGAHPTSMPGFYEVDRSYMAQKYVPSSVDDSAMAAFLSSQIRSGSESDYLNRVGGIELAKELLWN
jgi:glutaconate CoA-transferase subunit A